MTGSNKKVISDNYLNYFNYSDVYLRNLLISLLDFLNNRIQIDYVNNEQEICTYTIPFYLGSTSANSERFMQDSFQYDQNLNTKLQHFIEGDIKSVPRGVLILDNISLTPNDFVNRFISANVTKKNWKTGQVKSISTNVNILQMNITFSLMIKFTTLIEGFKIFEKILNECYKTHQIQFSFNGVMMSAWVGFPEDLELKNTYEFSFGDEKETQLDLNLEVESYYPIFDNTTEQGSNKHIEQFIVNMYDVQTDIPRTETSTGIVNIDKTIDKLGDGKSIFIEKMDTVIEMNKNKNIDYQKDDKIGEKIEFIKKESDNKDLFFEKLGNKLAINPEDKTGNKYNNKGDISDK